MAIDSWLFEQFCQGNQPPVLRFYTWKPIAISLGFHQSRYPIEWRNLSWQGEAIDLVRRPSGGRAVLHQGDLTYAVITSGEGNRMQAYRSICEFLIAGWRSLGINLDFGSAGRGYIHNPNCFGTATAADLVMPEGTKLIGSAQVRRGTAILQHGSIRLEPDRALFQQVFGTDEAINVPTISQSDLIFALEAAAEACFQMSLQPAPLTEAEWQQIKSQPADRAIASSSSPGG
ncbi:lipoate--protein ligase family protein [Microcoleus sp. FACHB-1515]|uniref:lipoate--protein ligase family protein n=1 Tax=Cyanophyceae TaxID=3028117 RepID=UPI0016855A26|nr:biotin/lipoate A/B protein ligase family protein [Microcoleus sp. FACHB-1515]MBD2091441.1 lipoate--protein ligase family protein [Microcoleus sp. FACHB-1515]